VAVKCHFIHAVYVLGLSTYSYEKRQSLILEQIIVFGEDYIVLLIWLPKSNIIENAETKFSIYLNEINQDCLICIVTRLSARHQENLDKFCENSFFFTTVSKLALEHNKPSVKCVLGTLSLRVKWLWHEAGCSSACSAEAECVKLYFHFLICLHVILLNKAHGQN
jgi:hypothetical protein